MKARLLIIVLGIFSWATAIAQQEVPKAPADTTTTDEIIRKMIKITKYDNTTLVAELLEQNPRELYVRLQDGRLIYIPQHTVKTITFITEQDIKAIHEAAKEDRFATRYFFTTNGIPIKKGEHYALWSFFGPDFQFGLGKNVGLGVMTSWLGVPFIATLKKSWEINSKNQIAIGGLAGTGTWVLPKTNIVLPFISYSRGNRSNNLAVSAGYGNLWLEGKSAGRFIASVGGLRRISDKISFVFDSFYLPEKNLGYETYQSVTYTYNPSTGYSTPTFTTASRPKVQKAFLLLIPGLRLNSNEKNSFQIGFSFLRFENLDRMIPIPTFRWFNKL